MAVKGIGQLSPTVRGRYAQVRRSHKLLVNAVAEVRDDPQEFREAVVRSCATELAERLATLLTPVDPDEDWPPPQQGGKIISP